jgi:hypothetical protein
MPINSIPRSQRSVSSTKKAWLRNISYRLFTTPDSKRVSSPQMWGSLFDDFFERSELGVEKGSRQLGRVCYYFFMDPTIKSWDDEGDVRDDEGVVSRNEERKC